MNLTFSKIRQYKIPYHFIVTLSAWISRVFMALVQILSVKILLNGLGTDNYSVFVLMSGLIGWYLLFDFGFGVSLQNFIAENRARNNNYLEYFYVAICFLTIAMVMIIVLLFYSSPMLGPIFLKSAQVSSDEKITIFFITSVIFLITSIGMVAYKVLYALNKGHLANIIQAVTALLGLLISWLVVNQTSSNKLLLSIIGYYLPSAVISILCLYYLFFKQRLRQKSNLTLNVKLLVSIFYRSFNFWFFNILTVLTLQIDYIIISQKLTPDQSVNYFVLTKLFGLSFFFCSAVLSSLWPIFTENIISNKWSTISGYIKKYLLFGFLFIVFFTLFVIIFRKYIINIISDNKLVDIPISLMLLMGFYQCILIWVSAFSTVLQSGSYFSVFLKSTPIQAIISIALQWILSSVFGLAGIILGLIISYLLVPVWYLPFKFLMYSKRHKGLVQQ